MATEAIRVALIGAGRMGQVHLAALQSSETIEVAGVVEPHGPTRGQLTAAGVPVYESVDDLLADGPPEGVLIAAPSDQHPALVSTFAAAGIPMLCEKPLGVRLQDTVSAAGTAEEAGVLLQVGYWRRFVPGLRELRERILGGELGEISQLSCMQWDADLPSENFRAHSGGITVDMGVHEFDQTRWLLGQEFRWVVATAAGPSSAERAPADPDSATMLAQLSGGSAATISLGRRFPHADSCWLELWGTHGYTRLPFMWDVAGDEVFRSSMRRQAEAFARALRGAPCEGAQAADAVAAQTVAGWAADALADSTAALTRSGRPSAPSARRILRPRARSMSPRLAPVEPFEVITTGRVGVDLYPQQTGVPLADVETFAKYLGGTATNVAVQAARLGSHAAVVTKVGSDGFGPFVRGALERFGVDPRWVGTDPVLQTPIVFCELHPPDRFPLLFYREPKAPDMNLVPADFDHDAVCQATLFWITATGLSDEPSRGTLLELLQERERSAVAPQSDSSIGLGVPLTVIDLDYRPMFWRSPQEASAAVREALSHVTVAVGNESEVEVAVGERDAHRAAAALLDLGVKLAIVKRGPDGVLAATRSQVIEIAPIRLDVVNGLGAGDAFGGTLAHGLARDWQLEHTLALANAAGALAASRLACADDFGTLEEIEAVLESAPAPVQPGSSRG
jgi:5-dehydro-2-deoxygluconokinase